MAHASLGVVGLIAGMVAVLAPKKAGRHVLAGRVFAVVMLMSVVAIAWPVWRKQNVFMLGLGTVAAFAIVEGWRALLRFRGDLSPQPGWMDHAVAGWTILVSLGLGGFGAWGLWSRGNPLFAVCLGFAALGSSLVRDAWRRWHSDVPRKQWLAVHIGHMSGGLGAAVTAAGVVNLEAYLGGWQWVLWVGPTVVGSMLAQRAMRQRGLV